MPLLTKGFSEGDVTLFGQHIGTAHVRNLRVLFTYIDGILQTVPFAYTDKINTSTKILPVYIR
jgi:hypothetical protein